jgi:2-polyprenyl-3-methyl-5-hydroxy-6-metoxy-1,4-benzoquinol methylase
LLNVNFKKFASRSLQKELLDRDDIPFADIERNMRELDFINTWLGGHATSVYGLQQLVKNRNQLTICEIGCGSGDNLLAISRYCQKRGIGTSFIGIDINPHCIAVARIKCRDLDAQWIVSDYYPVRFDRGKPDIIFSSLFCHHFTDEELVIMLRWMQTNAGTGFFINDLHRHPFAYYAIRGLTGLFSRSYLVKNDAPVSVLRGFTRQEWILLLERAGIVSCTLEWKWAFRWLLISG